MQLRTCLSSVFMLSTALLTLLVAVDANALPSEDVPTSEPEYLAKVKTAAPEQIVAKSTITIKMKDGTTKILQSGTNGFTCMVGGDGTPLCADGNALAWMKAVGAKTEPSNKVGFIYMLAGDTGTNNEAAGQHALHQHWVQTGPHVMIVGPMVKDMPGYSRTVDAADPTQPYAMFPGTPYEHLMLPVTEK
jgi:hypothetical protein